MGTWWITTIGLLLCLGFVGGTIFHFINGALDSEDATRIDPIKNETEDESSQNEP